MTRPLAITSRIVRLKGKAGAVLVLLVVLLVFMDQF
jgi:hypothetical protein